MPGAVVEFLNAPTSLACHYQNRTCKMDSFQFLYSIPIFPMSRCVESCFEHGFRNPADKYCYAHPAASQNLSELYGSDSRRKTTSLRPELYSTTPSYIKHNLCLSSNKIRKNWLEHAEPKSYCPIIQSPITAISWNKGLKCRTGKLNYCSSISAPALPIHVISLPIPWTVWQLAKEKTKINKASPRIILLTIFQNSPLSAINLIRHYHGIWL